MGIAIFLDALANMLIKVGVRDKGGKFSINIFCDIITTPAIIGRVLSFVFALIVYGYVLTKMNLSIAYPLMTSIGFVIVILATRFFLKESITLISDTWSLIHSSGVWMVAK